MRSIDLLPREVYVVVGRGIPDTLPRFLQEEEVRLELPYSSESIRLEARDVLLHGLEPVGLDGVIRYLSSKVTFSGEGFSA